MPRFYTDEIQDAPAYEAIAPPEELTPYYGRTSPLEREASGYIAPHVDEFGQVQSTAYDSRAADIEAETLARRFKGQQLYQSLVDGGASPLEAFRLAAPDLLYNDIKGQMKVAPRMSQEPFTPRAMNVGGVEMVQRSPNEWMRASNVTAPEVVTERETRKRSGQLEYDQIQRAGQDLQRAITARDKLEKSDEGRMVAAQAVAAAEARLKDLEKSYAAPAIAATTEALPPPPVLETVTKAGPEANKGKGGIEMTRQPKAGEAASDEKVVVTKGGKRFRLPKSQLAEAEKEGYKLAQ